MHEKFDYYVQYGSIYSRSSGIMFGEDVTVLVDLSMGSLSKVGDKQWVEKHFHERCAKYQSMGMPEMANNLLCITFNIKYENLGFAPEGYNLDVDEVCTILNWLSNHPKPERMQHFLSSPEPELKKEIQRLQSIGF